MKMIAGKLGMTKKLKRAARLAGMTSNRKRDKANWRSSYHSQFKRKSGHRGYPKGQPGEAGFIDRSKSRLP